MSDATTCDLRETVILDGVPYRVPPDIIKQGDYAIREYLEFTEALKEYAQSCPAPPSEANAHHIDGKWYDPEQKELRPRVLFRGEWREVPIDILVEGPDATRDYLNVAYGAED